MADTLQMGLQIFFGDLQLKAVHRGIGLDRCGIDGLGMATDHALVHTHGQYPCEHFLKNRLGEQLPCPADGTVPGQFLVDIITQEIKDIQPHTTMDDQIPVTDDIFQISHKTQLEEDHRVDALLAAPAIVDLGQWIQKVQIQHRFQPPVKIVLWNTFAQLEMGEQFFLIIFLALHT